MAALTLSTAARNAACDAIVDLIDAGAGDGYIEIQTSGDTVLVKNLFQDPAFGDAAAGVATANLPMDDGTAIATGTAAKARIADSDDTVIISEMTVGTGSEDVVLGSTSITTGDIIRYTAGTITVPAT